MCVSRRLLDVSSIDGPVFQGNKLLVALRLMMLSFPNMSFEGDEGKAGGGVGGGGGGGDGEGGDGTQDPPKKLMLITMIVILKNNNNKLK